MARNEEKANSLFNRFQAAKDADQGKTVQRARRPHLASECSVLPEAEKWRRQVISDIRRGVAEIQNAALGEHRIRDLNDQINKHIREKRHWEKRILELGGPDYAKSAPADDAEGAELVGAGGYKYFGAAKELPGVRELFAEEAAQAPVRRTRAQIFRGIDPDYYGFRDEDDGTLLLVEAEAERDAVAAAVAEWKEESRKRKRVPGDDEDLGDVVGDAAGAAGAAGAGAGAGAGPGTGAGGLSSAAANTDFRAHVELPDEEAIRKAIMAKKKAALLAKYAGK